MTLDEFLEELKEIAPLYTWHLTNEGRIRSNCGCPLETLAHFRKGEGRGFMYNLLGAAEACGIVFTSGLIDEIICIADYKACPSFTVFAHKNTLENRKRLLEITGLKES